MLVTRRKTRMVTVGKVRLGHTAPVAVQTMTKVPLEDVDATLAQIGEVADLGCDIIRCAVPNIKQVHSFRAVLAGSPLPVVADIHFDWRIALAAIDAGAPKIRINPGNMEDGEGLARVAAAAKDAGVALRLGVNSGSIKHRTPDDTRPLAEILAAAAIDYAARFEALGVSNLVLSLKASDPMTTIAANRLVAGQCDYPLHLGVTAAGPEEESMLRSAIGIGALLADGIGDTIRVSFTGPPAAEVKAAQQLLRAAGLLCDRPRLMSCPTCARCSVDLRPLVEEVRAALVDVGTPLTVAVMGCEVNGPGEAREADVGLAAAGGRLVLFARGEKVRSVSPEEAVSALLGEIQALSSETEEARGRD